MKGQSTSRQSSRRTFLQVPLVAGAGGALVGAGVWVGRDQGQPGSPARAQESRPRAIDETDPRNIKIAHRLSARISDEDLLFLKQIGLRWARVDFPPEDAAVDSMRATQERYRRHGIEIIAATHYAYRSLKVQLGLAGRDEDIETYRGFLRNLGRLGIGVSCYDFHPANTYTTAHVEHRGYVAREFDLAAFRQRIEKQRFDREYSAEEIWENYTYFIRAVLPVAEEAGVRLALHPDDPPVSKMNGVAKVLTHYEGYRRAEAIAAGSPNWGLTLCVGTWIEGGDQMGKDVFEMIADFGGRGKIFDIHLRNVSSPLPRFVETFLDDGYVDMYRVVRALRKVRFDGSMVPDHIPQMAGDKGIRPAGTAYSIAYMRALLRRANEEVG